METHPNSRHIPYAPTETADLYPESDGKPMAETDMHAVAIIDLRQRFDGFFADNLDTYISGTLMMYDVEGPGRTAVSPDILVSFGIGKKLRRTYKVWEEGKPPDFVMEFSSKGTFQNDLGHKKAHYASMGIPEYFLCDIDRRYLPTPLMGFRLKDGTYERIPENADGGISSVTLGVSFHLLDEGLAVYDAATGQWLQTPAEAAEQRAEQEAAARAREAAARAEAEAEASRLREELERLKARLSDD
ncbi:Uma2 family endonuclease [Candidatus Poribacteria bacterium]|nr:Uma2 family endonuclease [Candidatus Poribacteria bacterium]MYB00641.1 Uma2 family endonuclease [Candidatus Poribacteria bacterium]